MKPTSILALICAVSLVTCTSCGDETDSKNSRLVMPDLTGVEIDRAEKKYDFIKITEQYTDYSDEYDEGKIIDQSVDPGKKIKKGEQVEVTVSKGEKTKNDYKMKDFTGMDYNTAKSQYGNNIKFVVEGYEYDPADENTIIWQSIEPGTEFEKGVTLKVKMSKGQETTEVPDLTGINKELAEDQLKMRGLNIDIIPQSDLNIPENCVIRTEPKAGEQIHKDTKVLVYVSSGVGTEGEIPFRINFPADANGRFAVELIIVDEDGKTSTISTTSIPVPETSFWEQDIKGSGENVFVTVMLINKETDAKAEIGQYNFNFETGVVTPRSEDVKGAFEQVGGVMESD